jgi:lysophospholipase
LSKLNQNRVKETSLDAGELRAALKPFNFDGTASEDDRLSAYLHFYGLDFENPGDIVHRMGYLNVGEYRIAMQFFSRPEAQIPKQGTAFVLHGYYDHAGIYGHPIRHLLQVGYDVVVYDQPGHGLSTGARATIRDFEDYQHTLATCITACRGHCAEPWLIVGQSMGGAIAMTHLIRNADSPFQKAILFAPLIKPTGWKLGKWLHVLGRLLVKEQKRVFAKNSQDKEFLRFLKEEDFLQPRTLPMQWVTALKKWIGEFEGLGKCDTPCLVLQGTDDQTVAWRENMKELGTRFPNSTIHYLPAAGHQLVNESEHYRNRMFAIIDDYLGDAR